MVSEGARRKGAGHLCGVGSGGGEIGRKCTVGKGLHGFEDQLTGHRAKISAPVAWACATISKL
jgi:hypothetical protein